jgi:Tfp pilus assembly protein PilV
MTPATAAARRQAGRARTVTRSPVPRAPRRVSGPARPVAVPRPAVRGELGDRLGTWVRSLPDHRLLDRLIRGRAWIVLIGLLLAGIVALQVSMLRLNAGISRSVEQAQTLQRQNQQMQVNVAALASDSRMAALAARAGFHTPTTGSERYLTVGKGDAGRAARDMKPPQPHQTTTPATGTTTPTAATTGAATGTGAAAGTTPTATTPSTTTPSSTTPATTSAGSSGGTGGTGTAQSGTTGTGTAIAPPAPTTTGTAGNSTGGASGG